MTPYPPNFEIPQNETNAKSGGLPVGNAVRPGHADMAGKALSYHRTKLSWLYVFPPKYPPPSRCCACHGLSPASPLQANSRIGHGAGLWTHVSASVLRRTRHFGRLVAGLGLFFLLFVGRAGPGRLGPIRWSGGDSSGLCREEDICYDDITWIRGHRDCHKVVIRWASAL